MPELKRGFASDNNAGIHPEILQAITEANSGHAVAYGADTITERVQALFKRHFGAQAEAFLVFNGTSANVLSIQSATHPENCVFCSDLAHIHVDECGAPERHTGCKLIALPHRDGKLRVDEIRPYLHWRGDQHHAQPKVISVTQSTEVGTVYTLEETRAIAEFAHAHGMLLHMDGARIANAAASLGKTLGEITTACGVDILSFGGTKNGLMLGEAVVFLRSRHAERFPHIRKQGMGLASKMRFISAQFEALLSGDLWLRNARRSNEMARLLESKLKAVPEIRIAYPVQANGVFAEIPSEWIEPLQKQFFFYVWDQTRSQVRWMASFDTTESDIEGLMSAIKGLAKGSPEAPQ